MPPAAAVIGAVAGVATVVGTVASINAQKKASRAQQRQQDLATRRSQRQAIREAQIRRAQALSSAQGLGAAGGSGILGGTASLTSQVGESLGFSTQMSGLSREISVASSRANTYSAIAGLGSSVFSAAGGFNTLLPGSTSTGGITPQAALKGIG